MPIQISICFYQELNDFLSTEKRNKLFTHKLQQSAGIKDIVESLGVPHTEVDVILVNDQSVDFRYRVHAGDIIRVYPVTDSLGSVSIIHLQADLPSEIRFILDAHLGRLAAYLRMLGFDSLYRNDYEDPVLADISVTEQRILLTCDRRLLMRKIISHGYFVRSRQPREQLREVMHHFSLISLMHPFTRCMYCNNPIQPVKKEAIQDRLQPRTLKYYDEFWQCPACRRIYWQGSHYQRMLKIIDEINK
jgi:uncharacterized protein with PIN domain